MYMFVELHGVGCLLFVYNNGIEFHIENTFSIDF